MKMRCFRCLVFFFLFWKQLKDIPFVRGNTEFRSEVSLECLGSSCDDQSCPPFKGSSLLKGATDCFDKVSAPLCFSGSDCWMAHLVGLGVGRRLVKWSGVWFYAFSAKAISFPLFFNVSWLEAYDVNLKNMIPPFQFMVNFYPLSK